MPRCGATFDENSVPPWTRGDFRRVLGVTHNLVWVVDRGTHPGAPRHPSDGGDFHASKTMIRPTSEFRTSSSSELKRLEILQESGRQASGIHYRSCLLLASAYTDGGLLRDTLDKKQKEDS